MSDNIVYTKMDKIGAYNNKIKSSLFYLFLEIYLEEKRWIHANPTLYDVGKYKDMYKRYYIEDSDQMERFYNTLIEEEPFFVIVRGKRGSGKTSFLNYFFNLKTRSLNNNEPNTLTWVRIDTTKLYKTIISYKNKIRFWEYLYTQILFVYLRYKGKDKVCSTHMQYRNGIEFDLDSCDKVFAQVDLKKEIEKDPINNKFLLEQYAQAYEEAKKARNLDNNNTGKCFECKELGEFLYKLLRKRLIVVIDGIDNINYNSNLKHQVWEDIIKFLEKIPEQKNLRPHKLIVALRDENHELLKEKIPTFALDGAAHGNTVATYTMGTPKLSDVMKKFKINLMDNQTNNIEAYTEQDYKDFLRTFLLHYQETFIKKIENIRSDKNIDKAFYHKIQLLIALDINKLNDENLEKWISDDNYLFDPSMSRYFKYNGYQFMEKLKKALRYLMEKDNQDNNSTFWFDKNEINNFFIYADHFHDAYYEVFEERTGRKIEGTILDNLFSGDFREQFIQAYKSYLFLMDHAKNDHEKRRYDSLRDYIKGKHLQITQSLFTNGNRYQTDKFDIRFYPPYRNINTINLLNILDKNRQQISPLIAVYLLVYLVKQESTLKYLLDLFTRDYITKFHIEQILQEFLEFGYIQVFYSNNDENTLYYKATPKGSHLIDFSFKDINAIQSYIYGGVHPSKYTDYFRVYTDDNYASQILFNMLLFWHEMQEQEELLFDLKNTLNIDLEMLTPAAIIAYKKLLEGAFPEHYIYSDIEKYVPNDKELQKSLQELHRHIMFEKQHFDTMYESEFICSKLIEILNQDERILYITIYIANETLSDETIEKNILRDLYYHEFIFDNIDTNKMQERTSIISDVIHSKNYWNTRYDMIRKLEFIKKKFDL